MKLEQILLEISKLQGKPRNFVAKHSRNKSGAGRHEDKTGKHAKRSRQKAQWKRDVQKHLD